MRPFHKALFEGLPSGVEALTEVVQGLIVHEDDRPLTAAREPAGQAWAQCRAGEADPDSFGLSVAQEGAMPKPGEAIGDDDVALFDRLAALTRDPDVPQPRLTEMYESDDRLRVPGTVFNTVLKRTEDIA